MGDIMRPIGFAKLMNWLLEEYASHGSIFGVSKLFRPPEGCSVVPLFTGLLETPLGPAAGPHTQLAQNIIAAYAAGARFFELKTVQILDGEDLPVSKPCITAADECYNCEWSTELRTEQALGEYIKAWFALMLISRQLGLGRPDGFIFNMSVGYDFEGITSPKIDGFIEGMKNAKDSVYWRECRDWALENLDRLTHVDKAYIESISPAVSDSITLSTLHGCPSGEIERIAAYLITEKNLNTFVKCNPTLLGYERARNTLDKLGYGYISFGEHHFLEDLQMDDAVAMFGRLMKPACSRGLEFGVKLTNTFPVRVKNGELPSQEMYMSGRALFPLSISVARRLAQAFDGKLRISFAGGADAHNISQLLKAGLRPVTTATTLLKPGGYQRLHQMALEACRLISEPPDLNPQAVLSIEKDCLNDEYYKKGIKTTPSKKIGRKLPVFDCYTSPCREGCPIGQDIPSYLRLAGEGLYGKALAVITERNPLPFITGTICPMHCGDKCLRGYYEGAVNARRVKLECAEKGYLELLSGIKPPAKIQNKKAAVIGGGPAGMSCAYFLAKSGIDVTIFEKRGELGGTVRYIIPEFRISNEVVEKDAGLLMALGVKVQAGTPAPSCAELRRAGYTDIVFAIGAGAPGALKLEYGDSINAVEFLESFKHSPDSMALGKNVAVIGGGNTAIDTARAALRVPGVEKVRIIYRRTNRYMPADEEEIRLAQSEGIDICELLSPIGVKNGVLTCAVMELGEADGNGRPMAVPTGDLQEFSSDTLIAAVGQFVDMKLQADSGFHVGAGGMAEANPETMFSNIAGAYLIGDARRGPSTVVEAIEDAAKAAASIAGVSFEGYDDDSSGNRDEAYGKKGYIDIKGQLMEHEKCLECACVCECCVDVCPNRANISIGSGEAFGRQILHIDSLCNECGNCETFCPYQGAPYKDKFTLFHSIEDFENSENDGFISADPDNGGFLTRFEGSVLEIPSCVENSPLPEPVKSIILLIAERYGHIL